MQETRASYLLLDLHLDVTRLDLLGLGQHQRQYPVLKGRLHFVVLDREGQRQGAAKCSMTALADMITALFALLLVLCLAFDGQRLALYSYIQLLRLDAWH